MKYMKYLSFLAGLSLFSGNTFADDMDRCCKNNYECADNPLYCGAWDFQVQAGVMPIVWKNRGAVNRINCASLPPAGPVTPLFQLPKFSNFYKLPWIVGGQIGYAFSNNTRVYFEFNYAQARSKTPQLVTACVAQDPADSYVFALSKYSLFDAYAGVRYYWDRWCNRAAFFFGAKIGLINQNRAANVTLSANAAPCSVPTVLIASSAEVPFLRKRTLVSGGADFGFDFCFTGNMSFVLTGAIIANCGPRGNANIIVPANAVTTDSNLFIGRINTELRFPVTLGFRHTF